MTSSLAGESERLPLSTITAFGFSLTYCAIAVARRARPPVCPPSCGHPQGFQLPIMSSVYRMRIFLGVSTAYMLIPHIATSTTSPITSLTVVRIAIRDLRTHTPTNRSICSPLPNVNGQMEPLPTGLIVRAKFAASTNTATVRSLSQPSTFVLELRLNGRAFLLVQKAAFHAARRARSIARLNMDRHRAGRKPLLYCHDYIVVELV